MTHEVQVNRTFDDTVEMEQWLQCNLPGYVVKKTWLVQKISVVVQVPDRPATKLPPVCETVMLPIFESKSEANKYNDGNGHPPILAMWRCKVCKRWHYWSGPPTDTSGGCLSGGLDLPQRIQKLIRDTEMKENA